MGACDFLVLSAANAHKIPRFGGWGWVFWKGGRKCQFYFYGRGEFSDKLREGKISPWMSAKDVRDKMLVLQNLEGLTKFLAGCPQGYQAQNFLFGPIVRSF